MPDTCGTCSLCCKLLKIEAEPEISFEFKSWNTWCPHCKPGSKKGGCQRYDNQPIACSRFKCIWLVAQESGHEFESTPELRRLQSQKCKPSNSHVVLTQSEEDIQVMFVYVDPAYSGAWREEPIRSHLIFVSNGGATVVIVDKDKRGIMTKGRPTFWLKEDEVEQLANGQFARLHNGTIQFSNEQIGQLKQ